jgi:two-component system sensor histidine kinase AlgZ
MPLIRRNLARPEKNYQMREQSSPWVPDFCRLQALFSVIVGAQLVVLILLLAPLSRAQLQPSAFIAASLFAQWTGLTSALLLCKTRSALVHMRPGLGGLVAWALPVVIATLGGLLLLEINKGMRLLPGGIEIDPLRFVFSCAALTGLIGAIALRYAYVHEQWRQQVQAQAKAEVDALQARIRPHFLFNSMNSIASLVRSNPVKAEQAVLDLSDLFRAALGAGEEGDTLGEEIELVERFLAIETLRLGGRLKIEWRRVEPLPWDLKLPRLVLQPLVENAIIHGIALLGEGGTIKIELSMQGKNLHVKIGNPRPADDNGSGRLDGNGHAQQSVGARLNYRFGTGARMITRQEAGYYVCELILPVV